MSSSQSQCEIQDATGTHLWIINNYEYVGWNAWEKELNLPVAIRCRAEGTTPANYWDYHWVSYGLSDIQFEPDTCAFVRYEGNRFAFSSGYAPISGSLSSCWGWANFIPFRGFDVDSAHGETRTVGGVWELEFGRKWDDGGEPSPTPTPDLPVCKDNFELPCTDEVCFDFPKPKPLSCKVLWPRFYFDGLGWLSTLIRLVWADAPNFPIIDIPGIELCLQRLGVNIRLWNLTADDILAIFGGLLLIAMISRELRS